MTRHYGFTGTQIGATPIQIERILTLLEEEDVTHLHHGDCIGADAQAHAAAQSLGVKVILHPPTVTTKRAWCKNAVEVRRAFPYLERNHHIVDASTTLIATPSGPEELRSGTWATIRYARRMKTRCLVITPDGKVIETP